MFLIYIKRVIKGNFYAVFMKKICLYIVFTSKMIKLNEEKKKFMLILCFLS